jgi:WhiB family transcriptional regulator, redox-sensing transcriptional regulator
MSDPYWRESAACAETDPHLWTDPEGREYPKDRRARIRAAKAICSTCPVIQECLAWALDTDDRESILGGTTASERMTMRNGPSVAERQRMQARARIVALSRLGRNSEQISADIGLSSRAVLRHLQAAREDGQLTGPVRKAPTADERCGTNAGRVAHNRRDEVPCAACRQGMADYRAERRAVTS